MTEPWLKVGRVSALTAFVILIALFFAQRIAMLPFAFFAHLSMCFFIATESFGPIAAKRTLGSRVVARSLLVPSLIVVVAMGYALATVAIS